jgi:hypothetical protein
MLGMSHGRVRVVNDLRRPRRRSRSNVHRLPLQCQPEQDHARRQDHGATRHREANGLQCGHLSCSFVGYSRRRKGGRVRQPTLIAMETAVSSNYECTWYVLRPTTKSCNLTVNG